MSRIYHGASPVDKILYNQQVAALKQAEALQKKYGRTNIRTQDGRKQVRVNGEWRNLDPVTLSPVSNNSGGGGGLANRLGQAYEEAKQANEQRYADINTGYDGLLDRAMSMGQDRQGYLTGIAQDRINNAMGFLSSMGEGEANRINRAYDQLAARQQQNLVSRGLSASTVAPTVQSAVERDRQSSLSQLGDGLRQSYLSAYMPASGDLLNTAGQASGGQIDLLTGIKQNQLGFQERRNDIYPDLAMYAQIAQAYGQGEFGRAPYGSYMMADSQPQYNIPGAAYGSPQMPIGHPSQWGGGPTKPAGGNNPVNQINWGPANPGAGLNNAPQLGQGGFQPNPIFNR